ncbi:MAG TPA: hypothetical protein VGO64_09555 [Candidatus Limnocylindrales bacterium]|nr:hypothetical protein [Candidatus Limnocylindrales bacterium]
MPHVSDARASTHDLHDLMLVAALAADDLAGTERDQAISLTTDCTECRALHDDLVAIARATSVVPAPIARPRDFQITPQQAASLRRTGWRRLVPAFDLSGVASRRLGVGLATFGLVGLLIGNVPLGSFAMGGGAASAGPAYDTRAAAPGTTSTEQVDGSSGAALGPVPAASAAASAAAATQPSASGAAASAAPAASRDAAAGGTTAGASQSTDVGIAGEGNGAAAASGATGAGEGPVEVTVPISVAATQSIRLNAWNVAFVVAIAFGLLLLLLSRRRRAS